MHDVWKFTGSIFISHLLWSSQRSNPQLLRFKAQSLSSKSGLKNFLTFLHVFTVTMASMCCRHCLVLAWTRFYHISRRLQVRVSISFRWSCLYGGKNKCKAVFMIGLYSFGLFLWLNVFDIDFHWRCSALSCPWIERLGVYCVSFCPSVLKLQPCHKLWSTYDAALIFDVYIPWGKCLWMT